MCSVDHEIAGWSTRCHQRDERISPDAFCRPPHEPIVERLPRTVAGRCIEPTAARSHHVDDAAGHPTVINPRNPSDLVRQERPKPLDLLSPRLNHIRTSRKFRLGSNPNKWQRDLYR